MAGCCPSAMPPSSAWRATCRRHAAKVWGLTPETRHPRRAPRSPPARPRLRRARDPPPGHLLRHDHAGARADGLLLLPAGAVHRRRGRHPGGAARPAVRAHRSRQRHDALLCRGGHLHGRLPLRSIASSIRPSARSSRRSGTTSRARFRSATRSTATSSPSSCCRRRSPALAGATKAIVFQLASLTDVHWTMSGEVVLMTLLGGMGTIFGPIVGAP